MQKTNTRILILRLRSIGDVLFTLPAVHCLRQNFPQARLTFLAHDHCAPVLRGFAAVDQTLALDRDIYRGRNYLGMARATWCLLRTLRHEHFTHAIDFHGFGETALFARWTGAAARWGLVHKPLRRYAYTVAVERREDLHPIDMNLRLLRECGLQGGTFENRFDVPAEDVAAARRLLTGFGLRPETKFAFVQPFTSSTDKDWPLENYLALAKRWKMEGVQTLFGGGPAERGRLHPVLEQGYPTSAGAGLMVSAALASLSQLVVGGDTGLLHLAVAMQKPVVMLLRCAAVMTFPYGHREMSIAPDAGKDLRSVAWRQVAESARPLLFPASNPTPNATN